MGRIVSRYLADHRSHAIYLPDADRHALEILDKGRCTEAHPISLLFVHGALHAAGRWDEHFLDFFADKGYRALPLSLRGHGRSPTSRTAVKFRKSEGSPARTQGNTDG